MAQLMKMAREHGPQGYLGGPPEKPYYEVLPEPPARLRAVRLGAAGAAILALAAGAAMALRR